MTRFVQILLCISLSFASSFIIHEKSDFRDVVIICDGFTKQIGCDIPKTHLRVVNVTYGREVVEFCKDDHDHTPMKFTWKPKCLMDATPVIKKLCDGEQQCDITAKPDDFPMACRQSLFSQNYLAVLYTCEKQ